MNEIFVLSKNKYFEVSKQYSQNPLFFGYWNSLSPKFGDYDLLDKISEINFSSIQKLLLNIDLEEFDQYLGFSKEELRNYLIIYGASLYDYSFVSLRICKQFEYLKDLIETKNINNIYFSYEEIKDAHSTLSNQIGCLNTDVHLIANNTNVTNLILFLLSNSFFKERVKVISKLQESINLNDLLSRSKKIKSKKLVLSDNNLPLSNFFTHKLNLNLVNSVSLSSRFLKKLNFLQNQYSYYLRSKTFIFFRRNFLLNQNRLEYSILKFIIPKVDKSLLDKLLKKITTFSFLWKKITISSLHLSSVKIRLLLFNLRNIPDSKCQVRLFNEHGSSFFKSFSHVLSVSEEDIFNAITIYRKNYPLKRNKKHEIGITTQKISNVVAFTRKISFSNKFPIIIGSQIFNDLKNKNYRYLLNTKYLNDSFNSLFELMSSKIIKVGFVPSKHVRRGNFKDPIYNYAIDYKLKILNNYSNAIINSSCLILTYPETTIADAVLQNIPFLLFCDIDNYPLHPKSKIWYERLREYGIAYKLHEFEELFYMLNSGKIYDLWRNREFKDFLNQFKKYIL